VRLSVLIEGIRMFSGSEKYEAKEAITFLASCSQRLQYAGGVQHLESGHGKFCTMETIVIKTNTSRIEIIRRIKYLTAELVS
jgi:hypothetical protein